MKQLLGLSYKRLFTIALMACITVNSVIAQSEYYPIKPDVTQTSTGYQNIIFRPGDTVFIQAGGCNQTGGSGTTWKRYVDPGGPNSDKLYHGLISIPGITNGLERINKYINSYLVIPGNALEGPLSLGYEDDNYSDNGYDGRDPGTDDQCVGQPDAYVNITIKRFRKKEDAPIEPKISTTQYEPPVAVVESTPNQRSFRNSHRELTFFQTIPGILTGLAALIGAIIGAIQLFKPKK